MVAVAAPCAGDTSSPLGSPACPPASSRQAPLWHGAGVGERGATCTTPRKMHSCAQEPRNEEEQCLFKEDILGTAKYRL